MTSRLVLGCGSLGQALVRRLSERAGSLTVVGAEESQVRALREEGISATAGSLRDPAAHVPDDDPPDTVVVATDDPAENVAVAEAVAAALPDALLVAYGGLDADPDVEASLAAVADRVVDPGAITADYVLERVGDAGVRTRKLMEVLRGVDGRLAVVTHDNPDPDAIASAVALRRIAENAGLSVDVCYYGDITHQENRAFVNLLDFRLRALDADADLSEYDGFALVDHSTPGVNDQLPEDTEVDVVIDHHPPRMPVEARFVDLRSDVGATSTLLTDYLVQLGIEIDETIATALLFGIRVDTREFSREVSVEDFEAAATLMPSVDLGTLERIEAPSVSADTLETIADAIRNRRVNGSVLTSSVGRLSAQDALAQAADRLLALPDVTTTVVYGIMDGTIYVSARSRGTDLDLGEALRDAFGQIGSAGGHADMAGAQIPLGLLEAVDEDDASLNDVVEGLVTERLLEAIDSRTNRVITGVYPDEFLGAVEEMGADLGAGEDGAENGTGGDGDRDGTDAVERNAADAEE